jgi:hypothetical protein
MKDKTFYYQSLASLLLYTNKHQNELNKSLYRIYSLFSCYQLIIK